MKKAVLQLLALCLASLAGAADTQPPFIQILSPSPGATVSSLPYVSVTFSEAVVGIDAEDLLINGEPALELTILGNTCTFTCSAPSPGFVSVYFNEDHGVTDQAGNAFDESAPGASWFYTLSDSIAPVAVRLLP